MNPVTTDKMNIVPILFTFDDNLLLAAEVCITSLVENAKVDTFYDIFVIHSHKCDFKETALSDFPNHYKNCRITFKPIEGEFVGGYEIRGITETCYYRLISPEIITEYDKILYSDVDVIFRDDLSRYYDIDLGDNYFAGVDNGSFYRKDVQDYLKNELGIPADKGYFYSGNLVINLKQLREDRICDDFRKLGKNAYKQQDMDIINIACNGRIMPLSPAFCLTIQLYNKIIYDREDLLKFFGDDELNYALSKGIIHYNGAKPWKTWTHHFDIWWQYYRQSIVFDECYYSAFFEERGREMELMPLGKRIKLLIRYFIK